jgi:hypothetical protein
MMIKLSRNRYVEANAIIAIDNIESVIGFRAWSIVLRGGYKMDLDYDRLHNDDLPIIKKAMGLED